MRQSCDRTYDRTCDPNFVFFFRDECVVRKYPSGLLHDLGEPQIVVRPNAKVVHGDYGDGPRMVEFGRGGADEQTGASTL